MEKPLFWHQGLFLQPQHLQLKDVYDSSQFTPYHRNIKPHLTGVVSMGTDSSSLGGNSFGISSGEFWFPDMTYAVVGKNAVIESRDFREHLKSDESVVIYVGLKKWTAELPNVTEVANESAARQVDTRFVVLKDQEAVTDLHLGSGQAQVQRMFYVLRLFFTGEIDHVLGYHLIPVAKVYKTDGGTMISNEFIPPCVLVSADDVLVKIVNEIADSVIVRSMELGAYKRKRGIHNAEFGSRDMVYLLVLISLNRYAAYFKQLQEKTPAHPHDVYNVIRQLVGELSSFSEHVNSLGVLEQEYLEKPKGKGKSSSGDGIDKEIKSLMAYNHDDLWACFSLAQKLISRLIEEITTGPDHVLEIVFTDPYYTCVMDEELFKGDCSYYLVMRTATELKNVVNNIDIGIKVTSPELMTTIVERSLPGALVEYLPIPPQELPRRTNGIYFKIDTKGEAFNNIRKEKQLALFWYEPPEDLKMELMVVKEK